MVNIQELESFLNYMSCISKATIQGSGDTSRVISIDVTVPELEKTIPFTVYFDEWYPAKACGKESIHFFNEDLIEYAHIMEGGNLCLHTTSSADWREKLTSDINQLCTWIREYYINKKTDEHFEHLVVNESLIEDCYYSFNYAQTDAPFTRGEYGYANYKSMLNGSKNGKTIRNYIVANFHSSRRISQEPDHKSPFSALYASPEGCLCAPYIIIDRIPGRYGKFIFDNYSEFESVVSQDQRKHLFDFSKYAGKIKKDSHYFPLFIGYHIPTGRISWNVAMIDLEDLPTEGVAEYKNNRKTGLWISRFKDKPIQWVMANDISPEYFFGRGSLPSSITDRRILIMGIGAIGSMVAHTLVRGGCTEISLYDFDIKHPGNICRSEYDFICPTDEKMSNLAGQLQRISPYVNITLYKEHFDEYVKLASQQTSDIKEIIGKGFRDHFDLIIDCTTDDDVMYALEQLNLPIDVVNISISNHANELVCAFSPSIYEFVRGVYSHSIKNDPIDIFCPTGCWNPTFKASYNDIASKLQFALKKIIGMLAGTEYRQNFIIKEDSKGLHFETW